MVAQYFNIGLLVQGLSDRVDFFRQLRGVVYKMCKGLKSGGISFHLLDVLNDVYRTMHSC